MDTFEDTESSILKFEVSLPWINNPNPNKKRGYDSSDKKYDFHITSYNFDKIS